MNGQNHEIVRLLLDHGATINGMADFEGDTCMHVSAWKRCLPSCLPGTEVVEGDGCWDRWVAGQGRMLVGFG